MLDLSTLSPDAADLEIVSIHDGNGVVISSQHIVVVLPVSPQHADGQ